MNENQAEIVGLLCAEGNYYDKRSSGWEYHCKRRKSYWRTNKRTVYIQFCNYNIQLLKWFQYLVKEVYGFLPNKQWDRVRICRRVIIADLLQYYKPGGLNWRVSKEVMENKQLIPRFIRGYFEGDGCSSRDIRFSSINFSALQQVQYLLTQIQIDSNIQGPYISKNPRRKPNYLLRVKSKHKQLFFEIIKPLYRN